MKEQFSYRLISDGRDAAAALERFTCETVVGLDTETYWDRTANTARVSLVQLASSSGEVILIDALLAGVESLRPLIESTSVWMAAHNARFDQSVLTGAGLAPESLIDTLTLARRALRLLSYSLAAVSSHLLGFALDKSLQRSNWRRRPLSAAQLEYAAADAYVTLRVYDALQRLLVEQGCWERSLEAAKLSGGAKRPPRRTRQLAPPLTVEERRAVARLKEWRLKTANSQRVPAYMICPDRTLEEIVRARPTMLEALRSIHGLGEAKIGRYGEALLREVCQAFA